MTHVVQRDAGEGPLCFLHVPKSAGTSVRGALQEAFGAEALAPRRMEASHFASFDAFDELVPQTRARVAVTDAELREFADARVVSGHLSLPTLRRFAAPARIATVLREPRARLLSYYAYLRVTIPLRTLWGAYGIHRKAEGSLADFLADPSAATMVDNKVCRMLLTGDPRIRDGVFIADEDLEPVAEAAIERLETLGFIGLLEEPGGFWDGLGEHFGVPLRPHRRNVVAEEGTWPGMLPLPPFGGEHSLDLLERRSAADAIVYRRVAAGRLGGETAARRAADAAFAEQLVRYGALTAAAPASPA